MSATATRSRDYGEVVVGRAPQASNERGLAMPLRAMGRAPFLTATFYLAAGVVGIAVAAHTDILGGSIPGPLTLGGWLVGSAALLYIVLSNTSLGVEAEAPNRARELAGAADACLDMVMSSLPDALVIADGHGRVRRLNHKAVQMFGYGVDEVLDEPVDGFLAEPYARQLRERWKGFVGEGRDGLISTGREVLGRRKDGSVVPMELSVAQLERDGESRFVMVLHDISARKRALARLDVAEKVLECTMEGVMVTDRRGTMLWVNQGFCRISGYSREEVLGQKAAMLKSGLQGPDFYAAMWEKIRQAGEWEGEIWNRRKDGEAYPEWLTIKAITDPSGQVTRYVGVFSDISKHKRAEETIRTLTYFDAVTHLPNRYLFMDRLEQALERAPRSGRKLALVMIGLNRFRQINETLGHQTGDQLLRVVADRLGASLRGHDTVARLRGDTFCCLLTDLAQDHDAHLVISRLLESFLTSFELDGHELFITAKVGISVYPVDGTDPEDLVLKAETAMNRSKELADNAYQFYTPEMHANSVERLKLETELRKAVSRDEFVVYYQPKIETATGRIVGAEALVRWLHHDLGMISPADFIPIAEETGLIVPIGNWVLDHVCSQIRQWLDVGQPVVQVAVNLSAHQFRQPDLVDKVVESLRQHAIDPDLLELELTESAVMHNAEMTIRTLMELHGHGVRLAVDDFGTGYSSLSYLKKFPLDKLKIDRSFVMDIDANPASAEIVGAIIAMGHSLNLEIVAEGVENDAQLGVLKELKCDEIQGFYYSRPIPAETFASILRLGRLDGHATASK
ncbi:MAG TPA: EAL domain-containing protein [Magnetospirillum sp.]|nr:EAL domain-containing protein [Magnetospirillum sp.]